MAEPLTGIVLAGGRSRRLREDKTLLSLGGQTMLERAVERLDAVCEEVLVAGGDRGAEHWPGVNARFVPDEARGRGPLAGLQAGLRVASFDFALVVAADMPFLNTRLLSLMKARPRTYQALVPLAGGRLQPLHAVYSRLCLQEVDAALAKGSVRMSALLSRLRLEVMPEEALRQHDPEGLSCFNINHPQDLERARILAAQPSPEAVAGA